MKLRGSVEPADRGSFVALTPVALRAPSVSATKQRSVYHVLGTKCIPCAGLDRRSRRQDCALHGFGCGSAALRGRPALFAVRLQAAKLNRRQ